MTTRPPIPTRLSLAKTRSWRKARGFPGLFLYRKARNSDIIHVMKKALVSICSLAALATAFVLGSVPAMAQDFDLTVVPAKVELTVQPGQTLDFTITLMNRSSEPLELMVYPMDYYVNPDNTYVFEEPGYYTYSCSRWVQVMHERVTIPPDSQLEELFRLNIPQDAEPGGHYGVLFFQDAREPPPEQGARPSPRVGSLLLLTVPGDIVREGSITGFEVQNDFLSLWGPGEDGGLGWPAKSIGYHLEVENSGNVHITVYAEIRYWSRFGFGTGSLELGFMTILPGTVRYFDGYLPSPPALGIYKAEALMTYGPDQATFDVEKRAETSFTVIPVLWILFIILGLLALGWIIHLARSKVRLSIKIEGRDKDKVD
jgi:plastocyanin